MKIQRCRWIQRQRQINPSIDRLINRWLNRQINGWMDSQTDRLIDRSIDRQIDSFQIGRWTARQIDKQTNRETHTCPAVCQIYHVPGGCMVPIICVLLWSHISNIPEILRKSFHSTCAISGGAVSLRPKIKQKRKQHKW